MTRHFGATIIVYGAFLATFGTYGAWLHEWDDLSMQTMYAGFGGLSGFLFCGVLASSSKRRILVAIGVHVAIVLIALFNVFFFAQAMHASANHDMYDRLVIAIVMGGCSSVAMKKALEMKPKREAKDS
eukprot:TRINITY_DN17790_c1_g2_i1.p1 TRINITY_DN17790_c1_g2~~TRINITY_DN17790_c1_g2_i1.p1  ORF type:complete len:128 (+),score=18.78 TRINITY_DN17790_c1_g2_i1:106-489(+)